MTGKNCTAIRAIRHPCVYVTVYVISVLHIKIYYNIIIGSTYLSCRVRGAENCLWFNSA